MAKTKKSNSHLNSNFIDDLNREFSGDESPGEVDESGKKDNQEFAKLLGESFKNSSKKLSVGDRIKGKILVLGQEDVFVTTGTQNDGVVSKREFLNPDGTCTFKVDDTVDLFVTQVRGTEIRLSRNPTDKNLAEDLEDAFDMMLPVQGRIVEVCKGGVRVNLKGKIAFCPVSQIDSKHVEHPEEYVGKSFEFRITQFSENGKNIVVSRRKILEEERELNMGSFLEENKDGEIVQGRVARLEKFGAFVELSPGVEGLVHISEIAWSRIGDPSEILSVGQEVNVKILKRETLGDRVKIALSIKQTTDKSISSDMQSDQRGVTASDKKSEAWTKFITGQVVVGKIARKELYGVFVQLEPGLTGLLHKSKIVESSDVQFERLKVGMEISVMIGEINHSDHKIALDLPRDPNEDDWKNHQTSTVTTLGTLGGAFGDKLKAAMTKKK